VTQPDLQRLRAYRLGRVRDQLHRHGYGACLLLDPINIRYATGTSNMSLWTQHSPERYVFVAADGPVVLFDNRDFKSPSLRLETVDEVRPVTPFFFEETGDHLEAKGRQWAAEIVDLLRHHAGADRRLVVDRLWPATIGPLVAQGVEIHDAQRPLELARSIKSFDELLCMKRSIEVCESGFEAMMAATVPGRSENEIWSELHRVNIANGGEWIETRLLASGSRTNPWLQESSDRRVAAGEFVACDADMIGPYGYCADISRTWLCGDGKPSPAQRELHDLAVEQIRHNIALLKPGLSFREFAERAWPVPERFIANSYCPVHGVGLADEWPDLCNPHSFESSGYDGVIEEDMTLCVESYIGLPGGAEGVKLEEQVHVTGKGAVLLSTLPLGLPG